jgi:choline-sulfatase
MKKPDLLVFMSDEHAPGFSSYEGGPARTPNMEKLCENGTSFTAAYTSCPLCVPARISMLMGKLPTKTGVFSNDGAIPETSATFLHSLVAAGYETVLVGRMMFVGTNQRHGFTKRFVGDMSPVTWNRPMQKLKAERGVMQSGFADPWCLNVSGGGDSPVLEYDKDVVSAALEYLRQDHEKPQCIVVGVYAPHFPYVAPAASYLYHKERMQAPDSFRKVPEYLNPVLRERVLDVPEEVMIRARAAYFGLIENCDASLGVVRDAFSRYLERNKRDGVFVYISDHGDQAGDRKIFGKETHFETAARIPFMVEGTGIEKGLKIQTPVSIMDLGPTLCELAGATPPPVQDGRSLLPELAGCENDPDRAVLCEAINTVIPGFSEAMLEQRADQIKELASLMPHSVEHTDIPGFEKILARHILRTGGNPDEIGLKTVVSRMVRKGNYKYITYIGYEEYDLLFDVKSDPEEKYNIAAQHPDIVRAMKEIALKDWDPETVVQNHQNYLANIGLVKRWEREVGGDDSERWSKNPEHARGMPQVT